MAENTNNSSRGRVMGGKMMGGGFAPGEKAKDFKGTFKKLLKELAAYKISMFFIVAFSITGTVFSIVGPKILGKATTELFTGLTSKLGGGIGINFAKIANILLVLIILYVISAACSYIQGFLMSGVSQKLTYKLRDDMGRKIHRMPFKFFDRENHGEVLSIITNDIDTISQSFNQGLTQLITSVVMITGVLVMMFSINWMLALVSVLLVPMSFALIGVTMAVSQKHFRRQQEYLGHVNGQIEEIFSAQSLVRVYNAEESAIANFEKDNDVLYKSAWKSQFISGLMMPIITFVGNLGYVIVAVLGGYLAVNGKLAVGEIQSFIQYVRQFTQPMGQLAQVSNILQSALAAAERVFKFLEEEEEPQSTENPVSTENIKGDVKFKDVRFGYSADNIVIKNFNADIHEGQKIAIVGPTGAGKTTMIKLLMRFYDLNGGAILIDKHDLRNFNRQDLRGLFGMVLQDTWLFNGTVMENIRYGKPEASDDDVEKAARSAHVHHFIKTLPDGYDMELNEESTNISQGQKQLLTIARAILADPKILILDEATSSVDTRTEERIQKAMDNLMKGRTSFIIAHRLSTIKNADLILVMDGGDIVEQGSHAELIVKSGFYAELYNSQFENISSNAN